MLNSYKQILDEYEPDHKDYDIMKKQLTDMTFWLNILNNVTDGAAEVIPIYNLNYKLSFF